MVDQGSGESHVDLAFGRWTPYLVVLVRALADDIVLCSWARHFTLTMSLSTQMKKWGTGEI